MILPYLLTFISGYLVKGCDQDRKPLFGITYGATLGAVSLLNPAAASVFVPTVLANFAAGKIDTLAHFLSLIPFGFLLLLGQPAIASFAFLFFLAAYLDEKIKLNLPHPRPLLPIAALIATLWTKNWEYLAIVLLFDAGYLIADKFFEKTSQPITQKKT